MNPVLPQWLQAILQNNPGNSVQTSMRPSWPFYPPGTAPQGGTSLIPRPNSMPTATGNFPSPAQGPGNYPPPAVTGNNPPPATLGTGMLPSLVNRLGGLAGRGSILGALLGSTKPTNTNEVPFYTLQNGKWAPNPAAASTGQLPSPQNLPPSPVPYPGITGQAPQDFSVPGLPKIPASYLQPSNGLDNTALGLQASQTAANAPQSPMAKLMAMLQQNGNATSQVGGIAGQ